MGCWAKVQLTSTLERLRVCAPWYMMRNYPVRGIRTHHRRRRCMFRGFKCRALVGRNHRTVGRRGRQGAALGSRTARDKLPSRLELAMI
jgi:hypothetical protein